ncbi:MAG: UDP-N-acetylglucosamine--N-acetylmuramyl-(pentapeptide) pyrophosphoryl-undecaprenol N-acetylglucosamine transferase, partial [Flavobacteriaceae bacterium]|nr:UDP-N-acetylglucosamine--N-acetylmuramyl-(pentapeptide) pyrophosphoryl-undecaprenol N-acetylglucosamine transferase [Flavobacteriaceae bacterium]
IISKFKPEVVIGTGGFASGPILFIASLFKIPTLIQEQNSYPGITNRILSKRVNKICVSYADLDKYFPASKIKLTGNPIRNTICNTNENYDKGIKFYDLDISRKTLLIIGGSQGSREINKYVYSCIDFFNYLNIQVIWQCGKIYYNQYQELVTSDNIKLYSFLERIDLAFSVSDYIVSRGGAGSISELCVVGKPVIFIPSPNVAEDHQTKNAKSLVDKDAAILIQEEDLETRFKKMIMELNSSRDLQNKLSKNIKSLAFENATRDIADEIEKLIKK